MKQMPKHILSALILMLIGSTFLAAQPNPPGRQSSTGPAELEQRYQELWNTISGEPSRPPNIIAHLGAAAGNQISVWVKTAKTRPPANGGWDISCEGTDEVDVGVNVYDPKFQVWQLIVTRKDNSPEPLPCALTHGRDSAPITLPHLTEQRASKTFSFLAYSCNEPFSTKLRSEKKGILARDLSLWLRMDRRATGEDSQGQLPHRPDFVLGVGDQIYVDPDPKERKPLAFFKGGNSDEWLIKNDDASLYESIEIVYRYNFGLPPLNSVLSKIPSFMMWDDHEIRDGWGSHDDEERDVEMIRYFRVARHGFIAHQLLRSYSPTEINQIKYDALIAGSDILHRSFSHGPNAHFLMLDSRSTRSSGRIFDKTAESAVEEWLAQGRTGRSDVYVLTVGIPLFPTRKNTPAVGEIKDDVEDGWDSWRNGASREALIKTLELHFRNNKDDRLLVISGDVHYSSLHYISLDGRVVGQEVVTSGIAHSLPTELQTFNHLLEEGRRVGNFQVNPAGKINASATFAEIVVQSGDDREKPRVDLVFHANGTEGKEKVYLANTHLLAPQARPLWYHNYRFNYGTQSEHIAAYQEKNRATPITPAGSKIHLDLELPKRKTTRSIFQRLFPWFFSDETVHSAIQPQSTFCFVKEVDYNNTFATSWDLKELNSKCLFFDR